MSKTPVLLIALGLGLGTAGEARAQVRAQVVITIAPPPAFIATSQPEYFGGRPVYWYNNNWYYRDHGRWSYYRREPVYLRDRRAHWSPERRGDRRAPAVRDHRNDRRDDRRDGRYHYRR